jgi:DNA-binding response OmpR family regulator
LLANVRPPAPLARETRPNVLIVEDNEAVARILRFCLREAGFEVSQASTGGEALRILQELPPEAAVLDLQLPDGQGGAVLDFLRRSEGTAKAPVWVVISALDQEEAIKRFGPLGNHFLAKPFDPWQLVAILNTLLAAKG